MPKGVSRAKHPELYGDKPTKTEKTAKKFGRGTRGPGKKIASASVESLHSLSSHTIALTTIFNALPASVDKSNLMEEINHCIDVMSQSRVELYPNPHIPATVAAPVEVAEEAQRPVLTAPPPAPSFQPHA